MKQLLLATSNKGKVNELRALLDQHLIILKCLSDFKNIEDVAETGETFAENASLKAVSYANQTGLMTIADDSGLEVKALGNKPGVFSARYAGENATDSDNINKLLKNIKKVGSKDLSAKFVCSIAIANENGELMFTSKGICKGKIALTPSGTNGFGYDPIFIPDGFDRTFGELSKDIKKEISHRAKAVEKIIEYLSQIASS